VNEVLTLDPDNPKALFRRAKATYLPINSSVEDLKSSVKDLQKVQKLKSLPSKRIDIKIHQITTQINLNRKRERETYSKMFFPSAK
jgi:hypothetical protein